MATKQSSRSTASFLLGALLAATAALPATGQVTSRVSVAAGGAQGNRDSPEAEISADGRFVAFSSLATNLVPGDTNSVYDIFVRDQDTGAVERVSVGSGGEQADADCFVASISADGRYVAFSSAATTLVPGDTNGVDDIFLRDRLTGTTERLSVDSAGVQGNDASDAPSISADGRLIAFQSLATNLVAGDSNGSYDVFLRDRQTGTTVRVSVDSSGGEAGGSSLIQAISADGRLVAFTSIASNLVAGDSNGDRDVFVRDLQSGTTERVSVGPGGSEGNGQSGLTGGLSISADGRFVAFASLASNLVVGDANATADVFVRDRQAGTTELASVSSGGVQGNAYNAMGSISISADGRCVGFSSLSDNLVGGDTNWRTDVFLRDRQGSVTERVSVDSSGVQGNDYSYFTGISADGRFVAFASFSTNLVPGDSNHEEDVFVRDRNYSAFASTCHPGTSGVIACPCSNPPGAIGQGCDNSAGTGGAILGAAGVAYLSMDTLVFTTGGEKPTALSIVMQGTASLAGGAVYGQGVRCVGGTLKRLYTKTAVGGSITAPDFGAGDPPVSVRSMAKGDAIAAGQSRWYLVYYRDPIVLGGCAASSTFNSTQSGEIGWLP
jgi:Tol biopolymer transport system component